MDGEQSEKTKEPNIREKIVNLFENRKGEVFTSNEIKDMVARAYPGTNKGSVIPSDYCYNITNEGIAFDFHIFEQLERGRYKVLGTQYDYSGPIYFKGAKVGEWRKGDPQPHFDKEEQSENNKGRKHHIFTWKPIYRKIAETLMNYRERHDELLAMIRDIGDAGVPVISLRDRTSAGEEIDLAEIDPFTFFTNFNRGITDSNRKFIIKAIGDGLGLQSEVPSDFSGLPTVNSLKSWFFSYAGERDPGDVPALWEMAQACLEKPPAELQDGLFERCLEIKSVGVGKLTMGLFWLNPDEYIGLDSVMIKYLTAKSVQIQTSKVRNASDYAQVISRIKEVLGDDFSRISHDAYVYIEENGNNPELPLNLILYGPPGTGKTYKLLSEFAPKYFTEHQKPQTKEQYAEERTASMSWWQVVTLTLLDLKRSNVTGIMEHPLMKAKTAQSENMTPRAGVWGNLQAHAKADCPNVTYARRNEPALFWKDEKSIWSIDMEVAENAVPELIKELERYNNYTPREEPNKRYEFVTFHQSYSYEDFVEGIRPLMDENDPEGELRYEIKPGIFKMLCNKARRDPNKPYALFIDELNRGNVANIFGELITLIESDKREGADNEVTVELPYSRQKFTVPPNLYIIGTMNTADRSVEALDTALRRRFVFQELIPETERLEFEPEGVDLKRLLSTINARIERLLDRDHRIGHSYLMKVQTLEELCAVFKDCILPLLQEYFYGDSGNIGKVLGERFVIKKQNETALAPGDWDVDEFDTPAVYEILDPQEMSAEDFRSIYE